MASYLKLSMVCLALSSTESTFWPPDAAALCLSLVVCWAKSAMPVLAQISYACAGQIGYACAGPYQLCLCWDCCWSSAARSLPVLGRESPFRLTTSGWKHPRWFMHLWCIFISRRTDGSTDSRMNHLGCPVRQIKYKLIGFDDDILSKRCSLVIISLMIISSQKRFFFTHYFLSKRCSLVINGLETSGCAGRSRSLF